MENYREKKITMLRHFKDKDDLRENMDAPLDLENIERGKVVEIAKNLILKTKEQNLKGILLVTSSKKRTRETAELIREHISKEDSKLILGNTINVDLREIDQGQIVLPEDYKPGQEYGLLKKAWDIFFRETYAEKNSSFKDNLLYRFGDPILLKDGTYKYSEIGGIFENYGESCAELSLRIYSSLIEYLENYDRFKDINLVFVTHSAIIAILKELEYVASIVEKDNFSFKPGKLPRICWDYYNSVKNKDNYKKFEPLEAISINRLKNKRMINFLKREIKYFKNIFKNEK